MAVGPFLQGLSQQYIFIPALHCSAGHPERGTAAIIFELDLTTLQLFLKIIHQVSCFHCWPYFLTWNHTMG
jgi:hypothetical protein